MASTAQAGGAGVGGLPAVAPPTVVENLKRLYNSKIKPFEDMYMFSDFHSAPLSSSDFEAKPMVLLLGQYSVGKTSFIRYLLGEDFPNQRIGPEPTTDRFVAVMNGPHKRIIPGNALCASADMPFRGLNKFGTAFLNKFEASILPCEILDKVFFVDTPGVLSGEKQRLGRSYNFVEVVEWFAERADMILLLFDAHKLDISDEFKNAIEALRGQDDKVRVVLNKADKVSGQQLMRVYGALMWSLGKVTSTPEVMRVYIGSFWDAEYQNKDNRKLFDAERKDLLADLRGLPRNAAVRKINELVKRARLAKVHAYILSYLRGEMPALFGKDAKQRELLANLPNVFWNIQKMRRLAIGDFPQVDRMRDILARHDFKKFPKLNDKMMAQLDEVLSTDIPRLMRQLGQEQYLKSLSETGPNTAIGQFAASAAAAGGYPPAAAMASPGTDAMLGGVPGGAGGGAGAQSDSDMRGRLIAFYSRVNPGNLHSVDKIMAKYRGRYGDLIQELEARYGYAQELSGSAAAPPAPARPTAPSDGLGMPVKPAPAVPVPARTAPPPVPAAAAPAPAPPAPARPAPAPVGVSANPFDDDEEEEAEEKVWDLQADLETYTELFQQQGPVDGRLSGKAIKKTLVDSGVPTSNLRAIWNLSDIDHDGSLDVEEFCVCMHLITLVQQGNPLPEELPPNMVPPSKRK